MRERETDRQKEERQTDRDRDTHTYTTDKTQRHRESREEKVGARPFLNFCIHGTTLWDMHLTFQISYSYTN